LIILSRFDAGRFGKFLNLYAVKIIKRTDFKIKRGGNL